MIFGSFAFSPDGNASTISEHILKMAGTEGLTFYPVVCNGFSGGYYLHKRLPYTSSDIYYVDETRDILVLLSGSVYNRQELSAHCNIIKPAPDPELIACLFLGEGPGFVKRLNGDFVILILQPIKKQLYLFRDQVGIRPMAYRVDSNALHFSTDINGLCRVFGGNGPIDSDFLMGHFKYIDYRKTPFKGVIKILPGHFLHFSEKGFEIKKYWEPENIRTDKALSHGQMLTDLKILLSDAVRIRCDSRFRAGAHVSSGIDSGIVSVLARKEYSGQERFYGFSWSPPASLPVEIAYDERELVRKLCRETGILPVFSDLSIDNFPGIVSVFYFNNGFFSEERTIIQAVDTDTNLIFSGWGGDEFVSTAAPSIETDLLRSLKLGLYLRRNQIGQPKQFLKNVVYYVLMPALGILSRGTIRSFKDDARYLKKTFKKSDRNAVRQFYFHSSRHHHHIGMLNFYHLQERCENWFMMGLRHGVEYRFPLLDTRIIEFMLRVPSELLCGTDLFRPLLREISEGILPDEIRWNVNKKDPVYWQFMFGLFEETVPLFMNEIDEWRVSPHLHFIDFELLAKDIDLFRKSPKNVDMKVLLRALLYTKAAHEFTKVYCEPE